MTIIKTFINGSLFFGFMNQSNELEQLISDATDIILAREKEPLKECVLVRSPRALPFGTLSQVPAETEYPYQNLELVTLGAIVEFSANRIDPSYITESLKNASWKNTMMVDRLNGTLPDFRHLRSISIKPTSICYNFKDPLNLEALQVMVEQSNLPGSVEFVEEKNRSGKNVTNLYLDDKLLLTFKSHMVYLQNYQDCSKKELEYSVQLVSGLVTRIHQDVLLAEGIQTINFSEYRPIFEMLFPESFENILTGSLETIRELTLSGEVADHDLFRETRSSKAFNREDQKTYFLPNDNLPDHFSYLVVSPNKQEMYVRFSSNIDLSKVSEFVEEKGWNISKRKGKGKGKRSYTIPIQKGGGQRDVKRYLPTIKALCVENDEGKVVAEIEGDNIVKLYLSDEEDFASGSELLTTIFYKRLLYTSNVRTAALDCDLTPVEQEVIGSVGSLVGMYNLFLSVEEDRARTLGRNKKPVSSIGWVAEKMEESEDPSFPGRILNVLNEIYNRVNPSTFYRYGQEAETQERLHTSYGNLQRLIGRFEAIRDVV